MAAVTLQLPSRRPALQISLTSPLTEALATGHMTGGLHAHPGETKKPGLPREVPPSQGMSQLPFSARFLPVCKPVGLWA